MNFRQLKLVDDGNAHGAAGTGNLRLSSLQGSAVQVGHLGLSDLGDLSLGDAPQFKSIFFDAQLSL